MPHKTVRVVTAALVAAAVSSADPANAAVRVIRMISGLGRDSLLTKSIFSPLERKIGAVRRIASAADVGVQQRRAVRGLRRRRLVEPVFEDRGDGGVGQRADLHRAQADRFGPGSIKAAEQAQHTKAGAKALFRMRPAGHHGDDQSFGVRPDAAGVTLQAFRRPFGITPVCTWHVLRLGAVPRSAVASGMGGYALAAMEHLNRPRRGAGVHLLANQAVRHRVQKALDFNVIVDTDAGKAGQGSARAARGMPDEGRRHSAYS